MDNPSAFMLDGSYDEVTTPQNGDIVYYPSGHSAIITDASSMTVVSKWGASGLYSHNVSHCPYGGNVKYYRPHHDHTFKYFKTSSIYSHD